VNVRVLVVDDQAPFRAAMTAVVESTEGFEVVGEAVSGEDSVVACRTLQPDLVLMDLNLPGIDGLEATRQLRDLPACPVVLLLSTHDADEADSYMATSGAAAYITKGEFGPERLSAVWRAS
jgi:DNA-binding NarL/FixJ family response regulator